MEALTKLGNSIAIRAERAQEAFSAAFKKSISNSPSKATVLSKKVGWLYRDDSDDLARYELVAGTNYLILTEPSRIVAASAQVQPEIQNLLFSDDALLVEVSPGQVKIDVGGKSGVFYHGDLFLHNNVQYRVALLSARSYLQWFNTAALILSLSFLSTFSYADTSEPANKDSAPTPPSNILSIEAKDVVKAPYRTEFDVEFAIPGLQKFQTDKVISEVKADDQTFSLNLRRAKRHEVRMVIAVDVSSLCVARNMEDSLNREVADILSRLDSATPVSLVEYYRSSNNEQIFNSVFRNRTPDQVEGKKQYVSCRSESSSINGMEAIERLETEFKELEFEEPNRVSKSWKRNVVVLITSGNLMYTEKSERLVSKLDLEVYGLVYSRTMPEYPLNIIKPLTEVHDGKLLWWPQSKPINFMSQFPTYWKLSYRMDIPYDTPEREYSLSVQYAATDRLIQLRAPIRYHQDYRQLVLYQIQRALIIILALGLIVYLLIRVYRYYRTPLCPKTGKVLSRKWSESLFALDGRYPVFYVERNDLFEQAYVMHKDEILIGKRVTCDLRLHPSERTEVLKIKKRGYETYQLQTERPGLYIHNDIVRSTEIYLKHGDRISVGTTQLTFLYPERKADFAT